MEDKMIKCIDCHKDFVFTAAEQQFYEEKGYDEPKRCKDCRNKRIAEKSAVLFNRDHDSAMLIENTDNVGTDCTEFTPVEIEPILCR